MFFLSVFLLSEQISRMTMLASSIRENIHLSSMIVMSATVMPGLMLSSI